MRGRRANAKEREEEERRVRRAKEKKGVEAQEVKPPTQTRATEALIGDEEQNEKQKKRTKKETASGARTKLPPDHSVASYDRQK